MTWGSLALGWALAPAAALWLAWSLGVLPGRLARGGRKPPALRTGSLPEAASLLPSARLRWRRLAPWLRVVALALLAAALLRPQTGRKTTRLWSRGVDIVLALDTSGSMEALDLDTDRPVAKRRSRLEVVREVVAQFVERRADDQIGIVVFGAEAFTQCPLTLDHGMVSTFLGAVESGMAGDQTAIGSGLATAVRRLSRSPARSKVVVLLTDGSNNAGAISPRKAAEIALAMGVKVYTIGAGARGDAPFLVDTVFGKQVQYAKVDIDEPALQEIAQITHGAYFRAEDQRALGEIYAHIDRLEKSDLDMNQVATHQEAFMVLGWAALATALLEVAAWLTILARVP